MPTRPAAGASASNAAAASSASAALIPATPVAGAQPTGQLPASPTNMTPEQREGAVRAAAEALLMACSTGRPGDATRALNAILTLTTPPATTVSVAGASTSTAAAGSASAADGGGPASSDCVSTASADGSAHAPPSGAPPSQSDSDAPSETGSKADEDAIHLLQLRTLAVNIADASGATPLLLASKLMGVGVAADGSAGVHSGGAAAGGLVRGLLIAGADPGARVAPSGNTPLHMAALAGNVDAARALVRGQLHALLIIGS